MENNLHSVISWDDFNFLTRRHFNIVFRSVDELLDLDAYKGAHLTWHSLDNWESQEDLAILRKLENVKSFEGTMYVVTEASYRPGLGPFMVAEENINDFVRLHLNNFGECCFNGDVLIISFELNQIWMFHHEGIYAFWPIAHKL